MELFNFSFFSITGWGIDFDYCDIEWFAWKQTTRPFRYDLNQIPYDYTVEVTNRFTGLDLIERVLEEGL